jgi:hypothetical protein
MISSLWISSSARDNSPRQISPFSTIAACIYTSPLSQSCSTHRELASYLICSNAIDDHGSIQLQLSLFNADPAITRSNTSDQWQRLLRQWSDEHGNIAQSMDLGRWCVQSDQHRLWGRTYFEDGPWPILYHWHLDCYWEAHPTQYDWTPTPSCVPINATHQGLPRPHPLFPMSSVTTCRLFPHGNVKYLNTLTFCCLPTRFLNILTLLTTMLFRLSLSQTAPSSVRL